MEALPRLACSSLASGNPAGSYPANCVRPTLLPAHNGTSTIKTFKTRTQSKAVRYRARAVISAAAAGERAPMSSRHPEDARSMESQRKNLGSRYSEKASFFFPSRKQNLGRLRPPTLKDWGARAAARPSPPKIRSYHLKKFRLKIVAQKLRSLG